MNKRLILGIVFLAAFLAAWCFVFFQKKDVSLEMFPGVFEIVSLNDQDAGGFSTSEISRTDTSAVATVNVRSGRAFPYAGLAFNLRSVDNRPVEFLNLSWFDSVEVKVASKRMKSIALRLLTNDPVYTRKDDSKNFRVLVKNIASAPYLGGTKERYATTRFALNDFKVPEWWLSAQGLEEDDGLTYFHRAVMFEVVNGDGVLRGIPDELEVRSIRFWGVNHLFVKCMVAGLVTVIALFAFACCRLFRPKKLARKK